MFARKLRATAAPPVAPDENDIKRLTLITVQAQQALTRHQRELVLAQQDRETAGTPAERQAATQSLELIKSEVAALKAELERAAAAVKRAEAASRLPGLTQQKAAVETYLPKRAQIVAEVDRSNRALAAALEALNNIDEKIYAATAGKERDARYRMGDPFHLVERRNRLHNSIPLCWPDFIRHKFQGSFARSVRDKKTLVEYENGVIERVLSRIENEIKALEKEARNAE